MFFLENQSVFVTNSKSSLKRESVPHGMCYSHLGNVVRNWSISVTQQGFISDYYKVKSIGQMGKKFWYIMAMEFVDHLGQ